MAHPFLEDCLSKSTNTGSFKQQIFSNDHSLKNTHTTQLALTFTEEQFTL